MKLDLIKNDMTNGMVIYSPDEAQSLIKEIWDGEIYTKHCPIVQGDNVIDIGANVGIFSIFAASCGANVYAFEPNLETFEILKLNIKENKLEHKIKAFNAAVFTYDGKMDLQLPVSSQIYTLGSATVSEKLKNEMCSSLGIEFRTVKTEAISLNTLINNILSPDTPINLLKIDCEGAEYDIFSQVQVSVAENILNIAMETHTGYAEIDLVSLLNKKGFIIDRFVKRAGHYKTGYCYARNIKNTSVCNIIEKRPVVLIDASNIAIVGEKTLLDAKNSFVLNDTIQQLSYSWEIDRNAIENNDNCIEYSFLSPGAHWVSCTVSNGLFTDFSEVKIVAFGKDYFDTRDKVKLANVGEKVIVPVVGEAAFCIDRKFLPKMWNYDKIAISIDVLDKNIALIDPFTLEFNGTVRSLSESYTVNEIDFVSNNIDITFSLKNLHSDAVEITWWTKNSNQDTSVLNETEENSSIILGQKSSELHCTINKCNSIIISKQFLPIDWTPQRIKLGVAAIPMGDIITELDGTVEYGTEITKLTEWYTEASAVDYNPNEDIRFTIRFSDKRNVKLVWWAE